MTEFYKVTGEKMSRYQKIRNVLLTVIVTLALQCTFEVCLGGYVDSNLVNGLNKLCGAFTVLDYTDLLTAAAVFVMLKEVKKRGEDRCGNVGAFCYSVFPSYSMYQL